MISPRASMLSIEGLRHVYGPVVALDNVSFMLAPGQTLAIFGPNGAGKTTLVKVLAGLIRPQRGTVRVDGGRRAIGWIGHESHLYDHLTVRENLLFWASLYGVPAAAREARAAGVVALPRPRAARRDRARVDPRPARAVARRAVHGAGPRCSGRAAGPARRV